MKLFNYKQSKDLLKRMIPLLFLLLPCMAVAGKAESRAAVSSGDSLYVFRFVAEKDMFYIPWQGNDEQLHALCRMVDTHRAAIDAGTLPVQVDSYCTSLPTEKENLRTAFVRANRVKSELITRKGLKEADFVTANYARTYLNNKDMVVVTLRIPAAEKPTQPEQSEAVKEQPKREESKVEVKPQPESVVEKQPQPDSEQTSPRQTSQPIEEDASVSGGRYVALKTNLAAWAGTIMNIAAEVQVGKHVSVELPVLWCPWYIGSKHAVKTFTVQPEVRYWLRQPGGGHFFGVHAHVGWFNVLWDKDRYQDTERPLLGAGISYGYLLPFSKHWAGEFTLGAGYANMRYDTFYNIDNGGRIDTRSKNYWGITRVGLSVVYRF